MAKITEKKFEGTALDKKTDKAGARKLKEPVSKFEGSKADMKMDKKAIDKLNKKRKKK